MTDKVQKIKEWISKEQDGLMDAQGNFEYPEHEGAYIILCNLDAYIDSLQEEPKFKTGDRIKPIDSCLGSPRTIVDVCDSWYVTDQGTLDFEYEDNWELAEEPAPKIFEDMLNAKTAAESLGISQEEHDKIVDECLYGKEPELVDEDDLPTKKDYRERYKRIAESEEFRKNHDGMSIGDIVPVEGEEPVSKDLEEAAMQYAKLKHKDTTLQKIVSWDFKAGAKWQKTHLWKPADGDDLPEYEREVVVFTQNFPDDAGMMSVAIGHRPNPDGWEGKSITTGEVEHYTPKTYDKGGWNIPDVKWWLDCSMPK